MNNEESIFDIISDLKKSSHCLDVTKHMCRIMNFIDKDIENKKKINVKNNDMFLNYFYNNSAMIADLVVMETSITIKQKGDWANIDPITFKTDLEKVIKQRIKDYNYPGCFERSLINDAVSSFQIL